MLEGLGQWLWDHAEWFVLAIVGYFIINLFLFGGKKAIKYAFWRSEEDKRSIFEWRNLALVLLVLLVVILLWW